MKDNSLYWYECKRKSPYYEARMNLDMPMFHYPMLAHALGGIQNKKYTNTIDALEQSYQCGFRFAEADLLLTEDNVLVCSHGFDQRNCERIGMVWQPSFQNMTHSLFLKQSVAGMKTMDAAMLYDYMKSHEDLYLELDMRDLTADLIQKVIPAFLNAFQNDDSVIDRCLMQYYTEEMHEAAEAIYHFRHSMMIISERNADHFDEIITYCQKHGIGAISIKDILLEDESRIKKIKEAGLYILVFSVDKWSRAQWLLEQGVDTICTNFIELEYNDQKKF